MAGQRLEPSFHRMRHGGMPHPAVRINEHWLHAFRGVSSLGGPPPLIRWAALMVAFWHPSSGALASCEFELPSNSSHGLILNELPLQYRQHCTRPNYQHCETHSVKPDVKVRRS